MKNFAESAKALAKNPLGIIALFLVLVYGIAALTFGLSAASLSTQERWIILLFVVLFPCFVLFAFYRLVTKHHNKLYAPADWRDESHFLKAMDIKIHSSDQSGEEGDVAFETTSGKTFGNEIVIIDGKRFEKCHFQGTTIQFNGTKPAQFIETSFLGIKWLFGGSAALTFNFVSTLYNTMGEELAAPFIESVISIIKKRSTP